MPLHNGAQFSKLQSNVSQARTSARVELSALYAENNPAMSQNELIRYLKELSFHPEYARVLSQLKGSPLPLPPTNALIAGKPDINREIVVNQFAKDYSKNMLQTAIQGAINLKAPKSYIHGLRVKTSSLPSQTGANASFGVAPTGVRGQDEGEREVEGKRSPSKAQQRDEQFEQKPSIANFGETFSARPLTGIATNTGYFGAPYSFSEMYYTPSSAPSEAPSSPTHSEAPTVASTVLPQYDESVAILKGKALERVSQHFNKDDAKVIGTRIRAAGTKDDIMKIVKGLPNTVGYLETIKATKSKIGGKGISPQRKTRKFASIIKGRGSAEVKQPYREPTFFNLHLSEPAFKKGNISLYKLLSNGLQLAIKNASPRLLKMVRALQADSSFDPDQYNQLSKAEQKSFDRILSTIKFDLSNHRDFVPTTTADAHALRNRFEVLKDEMAAGNHSEDTVKELLRVLADLKDCRAISGKKYASLTGAINSFMSE